MPGGGGMDPPGGGMNGGLLNLKLEMSEKPSKHPTFSFYSNTKLKNYTISGI